MSSTRLCSSAACLVLLLLTGCQGAEPSPCDAEERKASHPHVERMTAATLDSITRAFSKKDRIAEIDLRQDACHFYGTVRVDSFATRRYAVDESLALLRVLKQNAPHETALYKNEGRKIGAGIYDYIVTFRKVGRDTSKKPLTKMVKHYDQVRALWMK